MPMSVSSSSVRSGRISLMALTKVVLPTPNPPATRIFATTGGSPGLAANVGQSERAESIKDAPHHAFLGRQLVAQPDAADQAAFPPVAHQDPNHPARQVNF